MGEAECTGIALGLNCISIFDLELGPWGCSGRLSLGDAVARCRDLPVTRGRTKPRRFINKVLCCFIELLNICLKTGKACCFGMPSVCFFLQVY